MNLPNFLTVIRLILIPFCGYALYNDHFLQAGVIFVMACITDYADGKIARKYNMVTNVGKLADPAADKLLLLTALFILAVKKLIPMFIPVTVLIKETIMGIGGLILLNKKYVVSANIYGKIATFFFNTSVAVIIILKPASFITNTLLVTSVLLMFVALAKYSHQYFKIKRDLIEKQAKEDPLVR
jgi:CDP-diacylglycerol--glycerol-3-phosphate 3-phosphatidyltransferase